MTKVRVATGVAIGVAAVGLLAPAVGRACSVTTQLSIPLNAASGPPSSTVHVTGVAFDPSHAIVVTWKSLSGPVLATQSPNGGNLDVWVTVPAGAGPGVAYIVATDNSPVGSSVEATYTVTAPAGSTNTGSTGTGSSGTGSTGTGSNGSGSTASGQGAQQGTAGSVSAGAGSVAASPARSATNAGAAARGTIGSSQSVRAAAAAPAAAAPVTAVPAGAVSAPGVVATAPNPASVPSTIPFQGLGNPREGFAPAPAAAPALAGAGAGATGGSSSPWFALGIGLAALLGLAGAGTATVLGRRRVLTRRT